MSMYAKLAVHRWMLRDVVRNEAYRNAILQVVKPGDVVLDMGAGTGILSIFAAQAGAKQVYAVERTEMAPVARRIIESNGLEDRIDVVQSDLEDVSLPEKVNVIVSEWMGGLGVDENMLAPLVMARDRWLLPGGTIIPGRVTAVMAPSSINDFDEALAHWRSKPHGVDMSVIATITASETFQTQAHMTVDDMIAEPQIMWSHDPYTCSLAEADRSFITKLSFTATRDGKVSALATWFKAEMCEGLVLTNAIGAADTHWGRMLFPLDRAVTVTAGTRIEAELHCDPSLPGSCEFYWAVRIGDGALEEHDTRPKRGPALHSVREQR
ncbi:MAG: 50S ribosomal protein L11 methyltransferase [Myxococcota bacterium]|nr:50S ribosomal protein L11 methyltransferase [Myxococcota bacterium]